MPLKPNQIKTLIGACIGTAIFLQLALGAYVVHKNGPLAGYALTMIIALFGVSLGWLVGLLASPYDDSELQRFAKYAGAVRLPDRLCGSQTRSRGQARPGPGSHRCRH